MSRRGGGRGRRGRGVRFGALAPQLIENRGVLQRRHVLGDLLATRDGAQQPAHDFAGAGLGQIVSQTDLVGLRNRTQLFPDPGPQFLQQGFGRRTFRSRDVQHHVGKHRFAFDVMRPADHGGLRHFRMRHQRRLDFHGAQTVPRHIQDIVDAAHDPVVAVLIAIGGVTGNVVTILEFFPIGAEVTIVVVPNRTQHRRPRPLDYQVPAAAGGFYGSAIFVHDVRENAR